MALSILSPDSLDLTQDFAGIHLGGTGSANQLDDYEEGTWTPALNAGSASTLYPRYIKIGNLVHLSAQLYDFTDRSSSSGILISGLPYSSSTQQRVSQGIMGRYFNGGGDAIVLYLFQNSSSLYVYTTNQGADYNQSTYSNLNSSYAAIFLTLTYYTD